MASERIAEAGRSASGSLIGLIEMLRTDGRTLVPFEPPDTDAFGEALAESELLDPEQTASHAPRTRRWSGALKERLFGS